MAGLEVYERLDALEEGSDAKDARIDALEERIDPPRVVRSPDDVLGTVEGIPFTTADILRWRRMEGPAAELASISWNDRRLWPSSSYNVEGDIGAVKRHMRALAEAFNR